ncbi:short transient receptor potential channel 4-like [Montipora foliosa]|uniref:short transient receptor potential channel 4-like n=1 Tax=Montipora foliosa TaxID=591990 RepID=UPI0035F1453C
MFHEFLEAVSEDVKGERDKNKVKEFFSRHKSGKASVVNDCQEKRKDIRTQLVEALDNEDFDEVTKLFVEDNGENAKTLKTLNDNAKAIAQRERKRTACLCHCVQGCDCSKQEIKAFLWKCCKTNNACNFSCCCQNEQQDRENCNRGNSMQLHSGECSEEQPKENFNEDEREWIKILSNPLYISLEWFRRISTKAPSGNEAGKRKENEEEDVIVAALRDSHLLQTIAGNDIHQHKKEYQKRAEIIEEFAKAVVEESMCELELHDIMDTQGEGCLKQGKPENFIQSLSVLKIATDLERMKFVASDKCQAILNKVIYYDWKDWQTKTRAPKILRSFLFLIPTLLCSPFYIVLRLWNHFCCSGCYAKDSERWRCFRLWFEHPYSKFVNHTMCYLVFLGFLIAASFEEEFGTTYTGLVWIDWVILAFVLGLLVQEVLASCREGCFIYFSKWWNVVDTMIVVLFALAYAIWGISYAYFGWQWKPENNAFITADVLFSSGIIMAFFHLTHIFQVDSVLGPLQLSLYRMLRDVWKFLLLFILLYVAFATGLTKMYSYYVASQIKLEQRNMTHHEKWHPYADHVNTFLDLFWLLLGVFDEEKISVKDPAFQAFSFFGHLFLIVYVVCMVIVALNMLIAMMNKSFENITEDSEIWKFSRTRMWLESIDKCNVLPSPLNLLYYILKIICIIIYFIWFLCYYHPCCSKKGEEKEKTYSETDGLRLRIMKKLVLEYLERCSKCKKEGKGEIRDQSDHNNKRGKQPVSGVLKSRKGADQGQRINAQINQGFAGNSS